MRKVQLGLSDLLQERQRVFALLVRGNGIEYGTSNMLLFSNSITKNGVRDGVLNITAGTRLESWELGQKSGAR